MLRGRGRHSGACCSIHPHPLPLCSHKAVGHTATVEVHTSNCLSSIPTGTPQTQHVPNWLSSLPLHARWHSWLHPVHPILINHQVPLIQMPEFLSAIFSFLPLVLYNGLVQTCLFPHLLPGFPWTLLPASLPPQPCLYMHVMFPPCIKFFSGSLFPTQSHPLP